MAFALFGLVLLTIGAAVAAPVLAHREGRLGDADAVVLAAVVLTIGLGVLNLGFLIGHALFGDVGPWAVVLGLAPVAAGALGVGVLRRRRRGWLRPLALATAAALTLGGTPGYFAWSIAALVSLASAGLYLAGIGSPRRLLRRLDPRE